MFDTRNFLGKGWVTINGNHIFIDEAVGEKLPNGLSTKVGVDYAGSKTHAWRWAGALEVKMLTEGRKSYGGEPQNEMERGNWFSNAPGNFKGYSRYVIEVDVPVGASGLGLAAPANSVGLDRVTGIWEHSTHWDNKAMDTVDQYNRVYPRMK